MKTPKEIIREASEEYGSANMYEERDSNEVAVRAIEALDAAGYVIVPKEATDRMCEAVDSLPAEWPVIRSDYCNMVAAFQTQKAANPKADGS